MPAVEMTSLSQALFLGPGQRARSAQAEAIVLVRWITTPGFRVWMEKAPSVQPAEQGRNLAPSEEREPAKAGLPLSRDLGWEARGRPASLPGLDTRPGVRLVCCWRSQFRVVDFAVSGAGHAVDGGVTPHTPLIYPHLNMQLRQERGSGSGRNII